MFSTLFNFFIKLFERESFENNQSRFVAVRLNRLGYITDFT